MTRLTRYILRQSLGTALFVTAALTAAIWLTQSLRLVDLIVNRGLSIELFLYLGLLVVPRLLDIVLPIGIFIAVLFAYNKLIAESEIIVMRAAGLSQMGLARPALILGTLGTLALFVLSAWLLPAANRAFKDLQFEIRNKFVSAVLQEGAFTAISDRLTVYIRGRDKNGELTGVLVEDDRDPDKPVTIIAERGAFVETAQGSRVLLANGNRQQFDRKTGKLSMLYFDSYTLDLAELHETGEVRTREPQERYLGELFFPTSEPDDPTLRRLLLLEAHLRIVTPLTALSLAILPLLVLIGGEFNRRGQARRVLAAVLLAFLFQAADLGLRNVAARYPAAILLLYVNALLPVGAGLWALLHDHRRGLAAAGFRPAPG